MPKRKRGSNAAWTFLEQWASIAELVDEGRERHDWGGAHPKLAGILDAAAQSTTGMVLLRMALRAQRERKAA